MESCKTWTAVQTCPTCPNQPGCPASSRRGLREAVLFGMEPHSLGIACRQDHSQVRGTAGPLFCSLFTGPPRMNLRRQFWLILEPAIFQYTWAPLEVLWHHLGTTDDCRGQTIIVRKFPLMLQIGPSHHISEMGPLHYVHDCSSWASSSTLVVQC